VRHEVASAPKSRTIHVIEVRERARPWIGRTYCNLLMDMDASSEHVDTLCPRCEELLGDELVETDFAGERPDDLTETLRQWAFRASSPPRLPAHRT
jgi:hypothetical protein